jgi:transglutaminase-like putative cysteine protease
MQSESVTHLNGKSDKIYEDFESLKREKSALVRELRFFNSLYRTVDITHASKNIRPNDTEIIELANTLKTPEDIYQFVKNEIEYINYMPVHEGAVKVLKAGKGDCVDQAELLASLLRAAGYTSDDVLVVLGTVNEKRYIEGIPPENHAWVEFQYEGKRLVLDPTGYLGDFEFDSWVREDFYRAFKIDDYFIYNDESSWIVKKFNNRFLE